MSGLKCNFTLPHQLVANQQVVKLLGHDGLLETIQKIYVFRFRKGAIFKFGKFCKLCPRCFCTVGSEGLERSAF